jgi:uncharacterized membrane protein YccC
MAVAVLLPLTGCGGGESELSAQGFARKADSICAQANSKVRVLGPEPPILTTKHADWLMDLTKIDRSALDELRVLSPASNERRAIAVMVSLFERGLGRGEAIAQASRAGDDASFRTNVDAAVDLLTQAQDYADRYGLDECARLGTVVR